MTNEVMINAFDQDFNIITDSGIQSTKDTSSRANGFFENNSEGDNAEWDYIRYFPKSGTYRVKISNVFVGSGGILKVGLDTTQGTNLFTVDTYNGSTTYGNEEFTTIQIARGNHTISFYVDDNHVSSSSFRCITQFLQFDLIDEHDVLGEDAPSEDKPFWEVLASVNGDGTSTTLSSGTITAKKYLWTQMYSDDTTNAVMRFNSDSDPNYARRGSVDGASDFTVKPTTGSSNLPSSNEAFGNCFIINNASNEKLGISHGIDQGTAGAGTAPTRKEEVFKWANTSDSITNISWTKTGNWSSSSFLRVLGHD
jgi:hypothetical protein